VLLPSVIALAAIGVGPWQVDATRSQLHDTRRLNEATPTRSADLAVNRERLSLRDVRWNNDWPQQNWPRDEGAE
jgi:hypothetical protein